MKYLCWAVVALLLPGCGGESHPEPGTRDYEDIISAFYTGVSAMEVGEDLRAEAKLMLVTELVPTEPAAWANLALMALRRNDFEGARSHLEIARELAGDHASVLYLAAVLELLDGQSAESEELLRRALIADSSDARAAYLLLTELAPDDDSLSAHLTSLVPDNLVVLVREAQRAAEDGQLEAVEVAVRRIQELAESWNAEATGQFLAVMQALQSRELEEVATALAFLRNVLLSEPTYRLDLARLRAPVEAIAYPITELIRVDTPRSAPAPADDSLEFHPQHFQMEAGQPMKWIAPVALGNEALPAVFMTNGEELRTLRDEAWTFPGPVVPGPHAVAALDYNYDFRTDLVMVGSSGLRLLSQDSTEAFSDVTGSLGLPVAVTSMSYTGVWAADLDLEGDIDLILAVDGGGVSTLRNNGDGTMVEQNLLGEIEQPKAFVWADFDSDGDPDGIFVDNGGQLLMVENLRQGRFVAQDVPGIQPQAIDIVATDSNSDGRMDLLVLAADESLYRMVQVAGIWQTEMLSKGDQPVTAGARLLSADIDNNGGFDLIVAEPSGARFWLQQQDYSFQRLDAIVDANVMALASIRQPGRMDLIGLDGDGQPLMVAVLPSKDYHWKQIRPRAAQAVGDQRINSFGIGGEVELRAGSLYLKQPITQPVMHFGLGDYPLADVARIVWPNGSVQAEFEMLSDQVLSAQQRLKGSCPWLFTWDGEQMQFVTDFIWRSPLGLRINAQETAGIMTTEDWVKVRGDQLQARDGSYDIRITAELWESHFFDHVSLLVVDHPPGTEVFVDERFAFPPPELAVRVTGEVRPITGAWDDQGHDVREKILERDGDYLDFFGRGAYQGITRDHYVEIELDTEVTEEYWLVASGWIRPTDSSINVAISQGAQARPAGLRLEALQADGSWKVVHENLGFPSGKEKTVLIDLAGGILRSGSQRLRLHTNLEIYWDMLGVALKASSDAATVQRLAPSTGELRYRGYSAVTEANRSSPELPHYEDLAGTAQIWRDLEGYYTRFGDVQPLLEKVDDRYVIMNAGDELRLLFDEVSPPLTSWERDYVLIGDGWVKDGDYNTTHSLTLRPLPSHEEPSYDAPLERLTEDPVYKRHPGDWLEYHTRYVAPERFARGLWLNVTTPGDAGQ